MSSASYDEVERNLTRLFQGNLKHRLAASCVLKKSGSVRLTFCRKSSLQRIIRFIACSFSVDGFVATEKGIPKKGSFYHKTGTDLIVEPSLLLSLLINCPKKQLSG